MSDGKIAGPVSQVRTAAETFAENDVDGSYQDRYHMLIDDAIGGIAVLASYVMSGAKAAAGSDITFAEAREAARSASVVVAGGVRNPYTAEELGLLQQAIANELPGLSAALSVKFLDAIKDSPEFDAVFNATYSDTAEEAARRSLVEMVRTETASATAARSQEAADAIRSKSKKAVAPAATDPLQVLGPQPGAGAAVTVGGKKG